MSLVSKPESLQSSDEDSLVKKKFKIFSIVGNQVPIVGLVFVLDSRGIIRLR